MKRSLVLKFVILATVGILLPKNVFAQQTGFKKIFLSDSLTSIFGMKFTDSLNGYVVASFSKTIPGHAQIVTFHTSDGGSTWSRIEGTGLTSSLDDNLSLSYADDSVIYCSSPYSLIVSRDYGATWTMLDSDGKGPYAFWSATGILRYGSQLGKSSDGGQTWQPIYIPSQYDTVFTSYRLPSWALFDSTNWIYSLGGKGSIISLLTNDGGNSWQLIRDTLSGLQGNVYINGFNADRVWMLGGASYPILSSTDRGSHWLPPLTTPSELPYSVRFLGDSIFAMSLTTANGHEAFWKNTAPGAAWSEVDLSSSLGYDNLNIIDAHHAWLLGDSAVGNGNIVHYIRAFVLAYSPADLDVKHSLRPVGQQIAVYPNPSTREITLSDIPASTTEIRIIDMLGRVVSRFIGRELDQSSLVVPVESFAPGCYTVIVGTGTNSQIANFVVSGK